jgi:hypothetical protein
MKSLRVWLTVLAIGAAPLALAPASMAQVWGPDVQMSSAAIVNAGTRASRVSGIKKVPSVGVVRLDVGPVISGGSSVPSPSEFRIMVSRNQAGVNKLRRALNANPVTRAALAQRGIRVSQVAGAQISSNGSLRLYIFSR